MVCDDIIEPPFLLSSSYEEFMKHFEKEKIKKLSNIELNFNKEGSIHFLPLLRYAYSLEFNEEPDYEKIRFMLKKIVLDIDQRPSDYFNWTLKAKNLKDDLSKKYTKRVKGSAFKSIEACQNMDEGQKNIVKID
jgi:hypothetical protein